MKKQLSLLLVFVMLVTALAGCTKTPDTDETKKQQETEKQQGTQETESADTGNVYDESGRLIKYGSAVTITAVRSTAPATVTYKDGDDEQNNEWTRMYLEECGINLVYEQVIDSSQWGEKIDLICTSGKLPDIMQVNETQFYQLAEAGLLADMTDAYENAASDSVKEILEGNGGYSLKKVTMDGQMMAIPWTGNPMEGTRMLYVRKDWIEATNSPEPTTWENFNIMLENFKSAGYPVVLGSDNEFDNFARSLFQSFGSYPYRWVEQEDGTLVYGGILEETKDALLWMQDMFAKGILDPDFGSKGYDDLYDDIIAGKCGILFLDSSAPIWPWQSAYDNDPTLELGYYEIPTPDDEPFVAMHDLGDVGYWVVSKDCENPEAAFLMLNKWVEKFYDDTTEENQVEFCHDPSGSALWENAFIRAYKPDKNIKMIEYTRQILKGEIKAEDVHPEASGYVTQVEQWLGGDSSQFGFGEYCKIGGSAEVLYARWKDGRFKINGYYGPATETKVEKGSILNDLMVDTFTKIVKGADISTFDDFVKEWLSLGGADWTDEVNAWKATQ